MKPGETDGKTIVFRDLTEIKEVEKLKTEQKKMKTMTEMSKMMAHEIKNPLGAICGSLEVLQESQALSDASSKQLVGVILKESERLDRTLNEFLAFSGEIHTRKDHFDLNVLLNEVLLLIQNSKSLKTGVKVSGQLIDKEPFPVFMDENGFKQVVFNLVLNGAESIEGPGLVSIDLQRVTHLNLDYFKLSVKDSGRGISAEVQDKIFEPFFTTRNKGMGLGLSVCNKISMKHSWELFIEKTDSRGTTFVLLIPKEN